MVFSSPVFLFLFLPVTLLLYFASPAGLRNALLLAVSLVFYAWGEPSQAGVIVVSIVLNFALALWLDAVRERPRAARWVLGLAVAANLGVLAYFKYLNFVVENLNRVLARLDKQTLSVTHVALPVGISFFTFHALSYLMDVYRKKSRPMKSPINMALYIVLFPQLIAGPIIRYHDVAAQIVTRTVTRERFAEGAKRFIVGLGKKALIANVVAVAADSVFAIAPHDLTASLAWFGIVAYTLQIYFDFSGYSDMAIGLGLMFGFRFLENFEYPYVAASVTEFWRRWHISLSRWFRDYLYIPLGGNRGAPWITYRNLLIVFFLCGLWHGAAWNFVLWGLLHGAFLVLERLGFGAWLAARARPLQHTYTLLVVMVGWVLFRADSLGYGAAYLGAMFGLGHGDGVEYHVGLYANAGVLLACAAGMIGALPWPARLWAGTVDAVTQRPAQGFLPAALELTGVAGLICILVASASAVAASTYNPFLYFRF